MFKDTPYFNKPRLPITNSMLLLTAPSFSSRWHRTKTEEKGQFVPPEIPVYHEAGILYRKVSRKKNNIVDKF